MGDIRLAVTMQGDGKVGEAQRKRDPLVLPGLMGIQLGCNWPIPPQAEGATYFPIHNHSLYYS